jgi:hypothetical protein
LGSTGVRKRAAYARDSTLVSANATSATAAPPVSTGTRSSKRSSGKVNRGKPCGKVPRTASPERAPRSSAATISVAATTAIRMPGTRGRRLSTRINASAPPPIASATRFVPPANTRTTMAQAWRSGPCASTEKPSSFGIWLNSTVNAMPFM